MAAQELLKSFADELNVAIIGASGGLGQAFIQLLSSQDRVKQIHAFSRSGIKVDDPKLRSHELDFTDENAVEQAAGLVGDQNLDLVVLTTGILHSDQIAPEKSLKDISLAQLEAVYRTNTFGPALVAKHFLPLLRRDQKSVFAALSARVGSIADNRLGGWYAYRSSKSALNMILKTAAIETRRRNKQACVVGLHPGTVDTRLSQPFQSNVKPEKLFSPDFSAQKLIGVIDGLKPEQTGMTFDWQGLAIPY